MPTNLNLDDEVTEASNVTGSATGWASRIITLIQRAFNSTENPFGSAATYDVGTTAGDLVQLDSDAKIPAARLPGAGAGISGILPIATNTDVAARTAGLGRALIPAHLNLLNATTTAAGLVARAGATEISARSNVNKFCSPAEVATIALAVGGSGGGGGTTLTADQLAILTHYPVPSLAVDDLITAINSVSLVQVNNAWVLRVTYESLETAGAQTADWPLTPAALALLLSATDRTKLDRYPTPAANLPLTSFLSAGDRTKLDRYPTPLSTLSNVMSGVLVEMLNNGQTLSVVPNGVGNFTGTTLTMPTLRLTWTGDENDRVKLRLATNDTGGAIVDVYDILVGSLTQQGAPNQGGLTPTFYNSTSQTPGGGPQRQLGLSYQGSAVHAPTHRESLWYEPVAIDLSTGTFSGRCLFSIADIKSMIDTHARNAIHFGNTLSGDGTQADPIEVVSTGGGTTYHFGNTLSGTGLTAADPIQVANPFTGVEFSAAEKAKLATVDNDAEENPPLVTQAEIDAATPSTTDERVVTPAILAGLRSSGGGGGGGLQAVATLGETDESGPYVKFDGDGTATTPLGIQKGVLRRAIGAHADTGTFDDTATDRLVSGRALNTALNAKQNVLTNANVKTMYEANADTNAFTDADHTKLDGIESGATGDQTAAEIRALVNTASNSNVFTDADHTKLNSIETGATADQTDAEIKTAYENNANTNAFTDALKTRLEGVEDNAQANVGVEYTQAEKTKLDGIDDNATDDQTAAELRTSLGVLDAATINTGTETDGKLLSASVLKTAIETHGGGTGGGTATGDGYTRTSLGSGSTAIGTTWTQTDITATNSYDDLEILLNYGTTASPDYAVTRLSVSEFLEIPVGTVGGSSSDTGGFIAVRGLDIGSNTGARIGRDANNKVLLAETANDITGYQVYGIKYGAEELPAVVTQDEIDTGTSTEGRLVSPAILAGLEPTAPTLQFQRTELYNANIDFQTSYAGQELFDTSTYTNSPLIEINWDNATTYGTDQIREHGVWVVPSASIQSLDTLFANRFNDVANNDAVLSYSCLGFVILLGRSGTDNLVVGSTSTSDDAVPLKIYGLNWVLS